MKIELRKSESMAVPDINGMGCSGDMEIGCYNIGGKKDYVICYVAAGQIWYNGSPVCEGQGFLACPGLTAECQVRGGKTSLVWICSEDKRINAILETFQADQDTGIFCYKYISVVKSAYDRLMRLCTIETGYFDIYSVFASIMQAHFYRIREARGCSSSETYLQYSMRYIRENISKNVRIEELAGRIGISQAYLYHIFKTSLGIAPKEYISRCRMEQARKLLIETGLSVAEIGEAVGYSDPMAFSRFFATREGISPSRFRKENQYLKNDNIE